MPRMKPPKGYYTMTEAKSALDVSDAMVRRYAKKGKIRYVVPEGREQGFYNKQDVDKLALAINAFLVMDNEDNELSFNQTSKEDLMELVKIANSLFSSEKIENPTIPEWRYEVLKKNPETQITIRAGEKIIGFTSILPFQTDSSKVETLLVSERVADANITDRDIETFEPGKHIYLYIAGTGIDKSIESNKKKHYGARAVSNLANSIVNLGERGVIIDKIASQGATTVGRHLLLTFGLHEIPVTVPGKRAFTMNVQESGSPIIMRYKKALEEWKNTQSQKAQ